MARDLYLFKIYMSILTISDKISYKSKVVGVINSYDADRKVS